MRTMIVYFIVLLAIPVVQVAVGPRLDRAGAPVVIDRSNQIILAVGRHLRNPGIEYPVGPWPDWRPRSS